MLLSASQRRGFDGANAIRRHMARTGCTLGGHRLWTEVELSTLRRLFPGDPHLHDLLPGRTTCAIRHKARQLGLVPPLRIWSEAEAQKLRRPYAKGEPMAALLEMFPGKTKRQIWSKANRIGIVRPRPAPKPTGFALLDQVRLRAHQLGLTMRDLDSYTGGRGYFCAPRRHDLRLVGRAVAVMGGRIHVRWTTDVPLDQGRG
ncbi:hypothetical protein [Paracoccus aminovorans]|uniref:hypothetical protein n=1 Tax=Paracoccus aminovorans TaxID=34004 RepID=UPI002B25FD1A|nr:hypothetical protein [Paracoccus aminovorans]